MVVIRFDVPFVTGLPRPRAMSLPGRRGVRFYADPAGETAKTAVAAAYHRAAAAHRDEITPEMFGGPVSVTVTTFRRLPKSTPKRITAAPDQAQHFPLQMLAQTAWVMAAHHLQRNQCDVGFIMACISRCRASCQQVQCFIAFMLL